MSKEGGEAVMKDNHRSARRGSPVLVSLIKRFKGIHPVGCFFRICEEVGLSFMNDPQSCRI